MGQIIEFAGWRRGSSPNADASSQTQGWNGVNTVYLDAMLTPWEMWRGLVASYASLWFAPLGFEVRPCKPDRTETASRRITQC